jgi:ABC-type phosphate transport system substrate-binding protein
VRSGAYPLSRYLYLHAVRPPEGWTSRFVDWVLTSAGQQIVSGVGYVSLWEVPTTRSLAPAGVRSNRQPSLMD